MKSLLDSLLRVRRLSKRVRERRRVVGEVASRRRRRKKGTWLGRLYSKDRLYRKGRLHRKDNLKDNLKDNRLRLDQAEERAKAALLSLPLLLLEAVKLDILPPSM
jgi:seryl-tRNA synthetase